MTKIISFQAGMSNAFYIIGEEGIIAVDSGSEVGESTFYKQCEKAQIDPKSIKLIIVSHGHIDHFANLIAMKNVTNAPILCHKEAAHFLINGELPDVDICGRTKFGIDLLKRQAEEGNPMDFAPKVNPDILMKDEFDLKKYGVDGRVIHSPGHSRGDVSVIIEDRFAIVGDLFAAEAFKDVADMPYFTYPGASFDEAQRSIQRILDIGIVKFYSGHGLPSSRQHVMECLQREKMYCNS